MEASGPIGHYKETRPATCRLAGSAVDRHAAFRLRYDVYIAEQGKPYPEADHRERLLSDELDADGEIMVVSTEKDVIVGTVRANWFDSPMTYARYGHVFEVVRFQDEIDLRRISVCSRLAASIDHRHCRARELLFETIYERGLNRETRLCFATCAPALLRMFRKYGFREYARPINDPVVGVLHRTALLLDDLPYLEQVGSPFLRIARSRRLKSQQRPWLTGPFGKYNRHHAVA